MSKPLTFKEAVKLLVDGKIIKDSDGDLWRLEEDGYHRKNSGNDFWAIQTHLPFDPDFAPFTLYEEPKPEKKVVLIERYIDYCDEVCFIIPEVNEIQYELENDAIRAAMEYLLGCKWIKLDGSPDLYPSYLLDEKVKIHTALFHRWPIEVIEE